jgi:hypothetical protein
MTKKIEVKKVVIQLGDKEAELTIEQARQLKDALNELLGSKETVYVSPSPIIIERPYTYPYSPYWSITWQTVSGSAADGQSGTVTYSLTP